eukprot:Ihof_evm2s30 gene=Ihof_evmTU2s30
MSETQVITNNASDLQKGNQTENSPTPEQLKKLDEIKAKVAEFVPIAKALLVKGYKYNGPSSINAEKVAGATKDDLLNAFNDRVARFYYKYSPYIVVLWTQLSQAEREAFILGGPSIPSNSDDTTVNGEEKNMKIISPEVTLEEMSAPQGLISMFNLRVQSTEKQEILDARIVQPSVLSGLVKGSEENAELNYTFLAGEGRGLWYNAKDKSQVSTNKVFQEAINKGLMVDGHTHELMGVRRLESLRLLSFYCDVFRHEFFEKDAEISDV